jgi:hypothetical protein
VKRNLIENRSGWLNMRRVLGAIALVTFLVTASCSTYRQKTYRPVSVTVISYQEDPPVVFRVLKTDQIAEMESFFPRYRCIPEHGGDPSGWDIGYEVFFNFWDRSFHLFSDGKRWTNTRGEVDLPVQGDLSKFLKHCEAL